MAHVPRVKRRPWGEHEPEPVELPIEIIVNKKTRITITLLLRADASVTVKDAKTETTD